MKDKFKKYLSSEPFFRLLKKISEMILNSTEEFLKQWLGTTIGQRFLKWLIDIAVTRFYDQVVEPLMRVGVIRVGYYFDTEDAKERIKKLKIAEDSNNEELYLNTLNDILRKRL